MENARGQEERLEAPSLEGALFRAVFGEPENAASYLRTALPPELAERFDLDQLKLCPGSFVDEEMRSRHIDLLFTAPLGRHNAYIYLLLEYGDRPHPLMAFKILSYQMRIWDRYLADNPGAEKIPAVIPVVIRCTREPGNDSLGPLSPLAPLDLGGLTDVAGFSTLTGKITQATEE